MFGIHWKRISYFSCTSFRTIFDFHPRLFLIFYASPKWTTYALTENESFDSDIWECTCGDGAMSEVLQLTNNNMMNSDLYDRDYGDTGLDFLETKYKVANIITNPPYNSAQNFVEHGYKHAKNKMALLLRLAFLEGGHRANTIFSQIPPSRVWVFSERITFYPKGADIKGSGTTAYAWFVWDKSHEGGPELGWIKPGTRKAYSSTNPKNFQYRWCIHGLLCIRQPSG